MTSQDIEINRHGAIIEITLNRPKANAIDTKVSQQLYEVLFQFNADDQLRVAIITGAGGKFFSAGWDLKAEETVDADHGQGGFAGLTELYGLKKPVIAAVNGYAVGGGFELALACDLIVASEDALFFLPEASLGIIPDAGGVLRLPKRLPRAIALEMLYTGKRLDVHQAQRWGLVNRITAKEKLMQTARELAADIIRSAPLSIAAIKEIVQQTENMDVESGYRLMRSGSMSMYDTMLASDDAQEGIKAFNEKRLPEWKGR